MSVQKSTRFQLFVNPDVSRTAPYDADGRADILSDQAFEIARREIASWPGYRETIAQLVGTGARFEYRPGPSTRTKVAVSASESRCCSVPKVRPIPMFNVRSWAGARMTCAPQPLREPENLDVRHPAIY
jgi:hypothetical protein